MRPNSPRVEICVIRLPSLLEIEAQAEAEAYGTVVGEVVERHLVVDGGLERDEAVDEEAVTDFDGDEQPGCSEGIESFFGKHR